MEAQTLCIFDLDGTLYRTASSFLPTMHRVYEEFGVAAPTDAEILSMVGETYTTFMKWLIPQGFPDDVARLAERISDLEFASIRSDGELFPGVADTFVELRDRGCGIALCTNGDRRYATYVLETHGLLSHFDALMTNDDDQQTKTDMVQQLLDAFRPTRALVIGDRCHDVEAGNANGCISVGVAYGYARPGELEGASYIIERFEDLIEILERADVQPA